MKTNAITALVAVLFVGAGYSLAALALILLFPALSFFKAVIVLTLLALAKDAVQIAGLLVKT